MGQKKIYLAVRIVINSIGQSLHKGQTTGNLSKITGKTNLIYLAEKVEPEAPLAKCPPGCEKSAGNI